MSTFAAALLVLCSSFGSATAQTDEHIKRATGKVASEWARVNAALDGNTNSEETQ